MRVLKKKLIAVFVFLFLMCLLVYSLRENILQQIGSFLLFTEKPDRADIIVILRGGMFERSLQTAELYRQGYGDNILVPSSLSDSSSERYKKFNIVLPSSRERLTSILKQSNVPEEKIIFSSLEPGGGTVEEAYRVKKDLIKSGDNKFIVVTSWYHSGRVYNIYKKIFSDTNMSFRIVASKYGKSNPSNWWHFRHLTKKIIVELPRSIISYIDPLLNFSFHDDPNNKDSPPQADGVSSDRELILKSPLPPFSKGGNYNE